MPSITIVLSAYLALIIACKTTALPEDWKPKYVVTSERKVSSFTGMGTNGEFRELLDLQEVKIFDDEWAIVTARNTIFVLDLNEFEDVGNNAIKFTQMIAWDPENSTTCFYKTPDPTKCNNFIRINTQVSENLFLMCGTNARKPKCREYEWNGHRFGDFYEGDKCTDAKTCLLDDEPSLAYTYSGGNLYLATRIGIRQDPTFRRTPVDGRLPSASFGVLSGSSGTAVAREDHLPHVSTDKDDNSMLNDPIFVSTLETNEKIYVFFRETAYEQFGNGEITFSRVAQVCKNDRGGSSTFRSHKWTSYFKARLNCSIPGIRPFHFNELRHMTRPLIINGVTTVFGVFTTPENSIWGSAVCAYTVPAIEHAMNGDFMKKTSDTANCWSRHGQNAPKTDPHPSSCPTDGKDTRSLKPSDLRFRRDHPLMKRFVQPISGQPLFMRIQARYLFSAIDVESDVITGANGRNVTLFYIGTSDGKLLKILPQPFDLDDRYDSRKFGNDGAFIEEWQVYDITKCAKPAGKSVRIQQDRVNKQWEDQKKEDRVLSINALKGRNAVIVSFRNCIIAVPKQLCSEITCRKNCVQSGNPYCGWLDGSCVPVTSLNKHKVEQDLFAAMTDLPSCSDTGRSNKNGGTFTYGTNVQKNECPPPSVAMFAVPIAVSLSICFILMMLIFFIYTKCKKKTHNRRTKQHSHRNSAIPPDQSYTKENSTWSSRRESNRQPIYKGARDSSGSMSATMTASRPSSFTEKRMSDGQTYVHYNLETSESATGDLRQPYNSMDSINDTFSPVTSDESERQNFREDNTENNSKQQTNIQNEDSNLNNNNMEQNIGIVYALSRSETPVRRRSVTSPDQDESTPRRGIRMGISSGLRTTPRPQCLKHTNHNIPTVMSVPPQSRDEYSTNQSSRFSGGTLPKPPTTGLRDISPQTPLMVSKYSEIESARNRTFKRGQSLNEPYYSETPNEPDYENFKQRKASTPGDFGCRQPPSPPPSDAKPNRKFSSFTASHFNTSWFPAPVLQEEAKNFKIEDLKVASSRAVSSSSSGITNSTSSASVSDTAPVDTCSLQTRNGNRSNGCGYPTNSRVNVRSTDEGYGSEFLPSEDRRNMNQERKFSSISESGGPIYDAVPFENNSVYQNFNRSPDDENIIKELDNIDWNAEKDKKMNFANFTKTLKKKKLSRKKKNSENRSFVRNMSSPDSDNVFSSEINPTQNTADMYNIFYTESAGLHSNPGHALDDSFVERNSPEMSSNVQPNQYAFHTMRPPGRMRQKLPRLRCGPKESDATLIAVPTPEIPKT